MTRGKKGYIKYYLFLLPAASLIVTFTFGPALISLSMSFFKISIFDPMTFVGLTNYRRFLADPLVWRSFLNVFENWAIRLVVETSLPLFVAVLLASIRRGSGFFRSIYFLPVVISVVSSAMVWRWLYDPGLSIINYYFGIVGIKPVSWLGSLKMAMVSVTILTIWIRWGYNLIILYAAIIALPQDMFDSASIDGANAWQKFIRITVPQLRPMLAFVAVMTSIRSFQLFEEVYLLTQGGPLNRTLTPVLYIYEQGFRYYRLGYGSTVAVVLFVILMSLSILQLRLIERNT